MRGGRGRGRRGRKANFETKFWRLYRVFLTSKPAAGGNFSGYAPLLKGKLIILGV